MTQSILHPGTFNRAILGPRGRPSYSTPVSSSSASGNNEPSGYTYVTQNPWDSFTANGWYVDNPGATLTTDATAPESPSGILRFSWPIGTVDGGAPGKLEHAPVGGTKLYYRLVFKHSSNFYGNSTNTNKMAFAWMHNSPMFFFNANGNGNGTLTADLTFQNIPDGETHLLPNLGAGILTRGVWHTFEAVLESNTPGVHNGRARGWVNGVATHDYPNFEMAGSGDSNTWEYISINPIWGGNTGETTPVAMTWDVDHIYISKA